MMSIHKSQFLQEEHGQLDQEAMASQRVEELRHQLESTRCDSQVWAAEVTRAWAVELCAVERATAAMRELDVAKVHLVEIEAVL